jgi:hypothetical protein
MAASCSGVACGNEQRGEYDERPGEAWQQGRALLLIAGYL